jgi:subtilase family serine protease
MMRGWFQAPAQLNMKAKHLFGVVVVSVSSLFFFNVPAGAAGSQVLSGHVPAAVKSLQPLGRFPGTNHLNLAIGLPLRNQAELSNLLQRIYDPSSPNYHHYLTPGQFTEQFGPTEEEYQKVIQFAQANGLTVTKTHGNRMLVDVAGNIPDVEKAFHVTIRTYRHPMEARNFFAPDVEPTVDSSVPVLHVSGLDDYVLPKPLLHKIPASMAKPASGSGLSGSYMGNDFRNAYVPGTPLNGSGQMVGLLQINSGFYQSDITAYESLASLPNVPVKAVLLDGYGGGPGMANDEVSLDIEMVISMAPGVSNIYVFEGGITDDILNAMAASNQVKQLSASWSYAIDPTTEQIFQQFAAQGQSFFNASGDNDAWLAGQISTPCDDPYITIVGGTTLSTANNAWTSETVWNWGTELGEDGIGSSGGISTTYTIPSWQTNINMTTNQGSTTMRNTPDVALTGDNVFVAFGGGTQGIYGGTSCATPLWAGFMALVNQQAAAMGKPPIGFANPAIYAIGKGANYASAFHDINTGNNTWSGSPSRFYAVSGYDLCTGWGTPAGQSLINALVSPEALLITPTTGFTSVGGFGGPFTVTSENLSLTNAGTNSLTWTLANTSAWLTVSSTGGTLASGGPAVAVTVSLNTAASNLVVGTYNTTIWFTNLNDNVGQSRQFNLSVISPPVITVQPTNQSVLQGGTAIFTVTATGGLPLSYQWRDNGTNLTDGGNVLGSTTTNLVIGNVSSNNVGTYTVTVTNIAGAVTSSNALLTIASSPPVIIIQPTNQTVIVGGTAGFSATAIGSTPLIYQWKKNGTNLVGQTSTNFTIVSVQTNDAGNYSVAVTNAYGSAVSSNATLTVSLAPPCDSPPSGLVSWWQAEGNANDSFGTNNGVLEGGLGFAPGEVGLAFFFNNTNDDAKIPASQSLNVGTGNGFTLEAWVNCSNVNQLNPIFEWNQGDGVTYWGAQFYIAPNGVLYANIVDTGGNWNRIWSASGVVASNVFQHVALTYDEVAGVATIYCNGQIVAQSTLGSFTPQTTYSLYLGRRPGPDAIYNFVGLLDEASIYNRVLGSNEIAAIYNAGSAGKCYTPTPPFIISQPTNQTVTAGGTASFTVQAAGTQSLSYLWKFNGTNILGATNTSLTLTNVQPVNTGNYSVAVTNAYGSAVSSNALLTVLTQPPTIIMQPSNQTVIVGGTAGFSVTATGSMPLTYQWKKNGTNIIGATGTNFTILNAQTNNAGIYAVAVTNAYGSAVSSNATLTVLLAPPCDSPPSGLVSWWQAEGNANDSFGTNNGIPLGGIAYTNGEVGQAFLFNSNNAYIRIPASPTLNVGAGSGFTVECWISPSNLIQADPIVEWNTGSGAYGVHFYLNIGYAGNIYANILDTSGNAHLIGTTSTLVKSNVFQHVALTYDKPSGVATLYYNGAILLQQTLGSFTPQTTYDLYLGRRPLTGGTIYEWAGLMDEVTIYNRALASNEIAAVFNAGSAGKCPVPPAILIQPTNQTVIAGATAAFSVQANGSPPLFYQWLFNATNILGATNTSLTLTNVQPVQGGIYTVLIANAAGSITSSNAILTVNGPPSITTQPVGQTNFVGATATFTVIASGSTPLRYQWNFNGTNLVIATNAALVLTNIQFNQAGNYAVLVTNAYGFIMSSNAALVVNPLFHFVWNPIPSPRFAGVPFGVAIQAQNPTNGLATNFTGAVFFLSTNGVPVAPAASGNFTQGIWTGAVTVAQSATNLVLRANDSVGETGLANPINIVGLPPLTAALSGNTLYIFWPVSPAGFVLETTPGLSPASWVPVAAPPIQIGDQYLQPVQMSGTNAFYHLRFTGQ